MACSHLREELFCDMLSISINYRLRPPLSYPFDLFMNAHMNKTAGGRVNTHRVVRVCGAAGTYYTIICGIVSLL